MRWKTVQNSPIELEEGNKMNRMRNSDLTQNAKKLRKSMTKEERHLWFDFLKNLSVTVNRQKVIGDYIVDFYIAQAKLAIELDGSQHYDEKGMPTDVTRDSFLIGQGLTVLRFSNLDIQRNFKGICENILSYIQPNSTSSGG